MSCEYNSIEKFWHASKSFYNKRLLSQANEVDVTRFHQLILESVEIVPTATVLRLCKSNRKFIAQMLKSVVARE